MSESPDTQAEAVCAARRCTDVGYVKTEADGLFWCNRHALAHQRIYGSTPSAEPDGEEATVRCRKCGGLNGAHGMVHRRHESGGGGSNLLCPMSLRCGSCGEPSIHYITLRGEPMPVCLRHLNHWRAPAPAQDGAEVEALAGVGLCDCGAEDGYRQPGNWHGRSCPAYLPTGYLSPSEVVARDAAVAAKVAEQITLLAAGWEAEVANYESQANKLPVGSPPRNRLNAIIVTLRVNAADLRAAIARAAAPAGDERE